MKEKCLFLIFFPLYISHNIPTILRQALTRKRIKVVEYQRGEGAKRQKRRKSEVGVCWTEHYITPLSTGSFRLSIHWQSSKNRPHRRDGEGTCASRWKPFFLQFLRSLPFLRRERIAHLLHSLTDQLTFKISVK